MLDVWNEKISTRICSKCGCSNVLLEEADTVLRCIMCGNREYKFYPTRSSVYILCLVCNSYYIPISYNRNKNEGRDVCNKCTELLNVRTAKHNKTLSISKKVIVNRVRLKSSKE
jgi:hypothetical protein